MDRVRRNSWLVRAAALVIFILGFAAGALGPPAHLPCLRGSGGRRGARIV